MSYVYIYIFIYVSLYKNNKHQPRYQGLSPSFRESPSVSRVSPLSLLPSSLPPASTPRPPPGEAARPPHRAAKWRTAAAGSGRSWEKYRRWESFERAGGGACRAGRLQAGCQDNCGSCRRGGVAGATKARMGAARVRVAEGGARGL